MTFGTIPLARFCWRLSLPCYVKEDEFRQRSEWSEGELNPCKPQRGL